MTVVVDTNVLPGMFATGHGYRPIADAWFDGIFVWAVSTEILLEYEEVLVQLKGHAMARRILALIERVGALQGNLHRVSPSFSFRTIPTDLNDDKFADCAIIADADHIITSDKHFSRLVGSGYKPQPIALEKFITRFLTPA
jgi:putative PIN family toxin of toxin-antitoxin system